MAINFQNPSEIGDQYLTILKTINPKVDISKTDSDWWIRSRVHGGVMSGVYADQQMIADDAFPQNARHEALGKHLQTYFNRDFNPAQPAEGPVMVSGANGTPVPAGMELTYGPNGNVYQVTDDVTLTGPTAIVNVQSVNAGQSQNLLAGAALTISSPPAGLNSSAVASAAIADGTDAESDLEAATAILNRIQQPPAGGTANDYETYAKQASPSVTSAVAIRYIYGLGTVGIVITAGTSDIDAAINAGDPVIQTPSDILIGEVQNYVDAVEVLTDAVYVMGPNLAVQDVTVKVRYSSGDGSTIEPNTGLSQDALVQREVQRALYKTPAGGRVFDNIGYVVASEIEEALDFGLSAESYTTGAYAQILLDRQVEDLTPTGVNRMLDKREIVTPGAINVISF